MTQHGSELSASQGPASEKALLIRAGLALYGDRWQTDLARDLGLTDGRRVRQWLSGDRPIPKGVWTDIAKLLRARKTMVDEVLADVLPRQTLGVSQT